MDSSFGDGGLVTTTNFGNIGAENVAIQSDGKIVADGFAALGGGGLAMVRYNTDGTVDTSFGAYGCATEGFGWVVNSAGYWCGGMTIQPADNAIVVAGGLGAIDVARFTADGQPDTTVGPDGYLTTDSLYYATGVAIQPDGNIVVAGGDTSGNFVVRPLQSGRRRRERRRIPRVIHRERHFAVGAYRWQPGLAVLPAGHPVCQ